MPQDDEKFTQWAVEFCWNKLLISVGRTFFMVIATFSTFCSSFAWNFLEKLLEHLSTAVLQDTYEIFDTFRLLLDAGRIFCWNWGKPEIDFALSFHPFMSLNGIRSPTCRKCLEYFECGLILGLGVLIGRPGIRKRSSWKFHCIFLLNSKNDMK